MPGRLEISLVVPRRAGVEGRVIDIFRCIICLKELPREMANEEHIFPEALGGMLVIREVCRECNSHLGRFVDKPLVDNWLMQAKRMLLGLPGKSGRVPNPLDMIQISRREVIVEYPQIEQKVCFDFWNWQRGILKIAYELAYKELGSRYMDDPAVAKIRALLQEETVSREEAKRLEIRG